MSNRSTHIPTNNKTVKAFSTTETDTRTTTTIKERAENIVTRSVAGEIEAPVQTQYKKLAIEDMETLVKTNTNKWKSIIEINKKLSGKDLAMHGYELSCSILVPASRELITFASTDKIQTLIASVHKAATAACNLDKKHEHKIKDAAKKFEELFTKCDPKKVPEDAVPDLPVIKNATDLVVDQFIEIFKVHEKKMSSLSEEQTPPLDKVMNALTRAAGVVKEYTQRISGMFSSKFLSKKTKLPKPHEVANESPEAPEIQSGKSKSTEERLEPVTLDTIQQIGSLVKNHTDRQNALQDGLRETGSDKKISYKDSITHSYEISRDAIEKGAKLIRLASPEKIKTLVDAIHTAYKGNDKTKSIGAKLEAALKAETSSGEVTVGENEMEKIKEAANKAADEFSRSFNQHKGNYDSHSMNELLMQGMIRDKESLVKNNTNGQGDLREEETFHRIKDRDDLIKAIENHKEGKPLPQPLLELAKPHGVTDAPELQLVVPPLLSKSLEAARLNQTKQLGEKKDIEGIEKEIAKPLNTGEQKFVLTAEVVEPQNPKEDIMLSLSEEQTKKAEEIGLNKDGIKAALDAVKGMIKDMGIANVEFVTNEEKLNAGHDVNKIRIDNKGGVSVDL